MSAEPERRLLSAVRSRRKGDKEVVASELTQNPKIHIDRCESDARFVFPLHLNTQYELAEINAHQGLVK